MCLFRSCSGWLGCARVLLLVAVLQEGASDASSSSSHSARYFLTVVSEPSQGLPRFTVVAYSDDQLIGYYDSRQHRIVSALPWVQEIEKKDPQLWDMHTQKAQEEEMYMGWHLTKMWMLHNQSGGFHTWQYMSGCELSKDGPIRGRSQYAYDGRDFLAFDKDTLTWTAASAKAQVAKRKWDDNLPRSQDMKVYLEKICIGWLEKYLEYGKETLLRTDPPVVRVTRKDSQEGLETLLCQAHGFYPREIDITWRRDGEVRLEDTFRGVLSPNADSTYYTWLSIEVDPQERSRYRCHVEHDGLEEPLAVAVEESGPAWPIAVGVVSGVLPVLVAAGVVFYAKKRRREGQPYKEAATSDQSSDSFYQA